MNHINIWPLLYTYTNTDMSDTDIPYQYWTWYIPFWYTISILLLPRSTTRQNHHRRWIWSLAATGGLRYAATRRDAVRIGTRWELHKKGWSCSSSRSLFLSQHPCCLKSRPNSIWCAEVVADLTPYGDKLKFISHSTYCIEGVGDLIPDKYKFLGLGTRRALPVCVYIYNYNR